MVGVVLVLICTAPFIILNQQRKRKKNNRLKTINYEANKLQCKIDTHEFCGNYLIGIDSNKKVVFFNKELKEQPEENTIELSLYKKCYINTQYINLKTKDHSFKEIETLSLAFIPIVKNKPEVKLEFYNTDINMMLSGELASIKKWENKNNEQLVTKK